jgi:hypothetical protein
MMLSHSMALPWDKQTQPIPGCFKSCVLATGVGTVPVARRAPRGCRLKLIAFCLHEPDRGIERAVLDLAWGDKSVVGPPEFVARGRVMAIGLVLMPKAKMDGR